MSRGRRFARLAALALATLAGLALLEVGASWLVPVREIGPSFSVYDPMLGSRHKRNLVTARWTPEFTMQLSTNSRGQRGPEPAAGDREAEARIVFVGDSFSEGYGVDDGQEFPRLVAAAFAADGRDLEVVNEGVGNTGTGRAFRLVRDYASDPQRQTLLVYQFSANDFGDDLRDGFFRLDPDGGLVEAPLPVPKSLLRRIQPFADRIPGLMDSHLFAALMQIARSRSPVATRQTAVTPAPDLERLTLRLLSELISSARSRGWRVVVLSADAPPEVAARVESVAHSGSAAFVSVPAKSERPDLYYRVDGHWNRTGHVEAASRLHAPLERLLAASRAR